MELTQKKGEGRKEQTLIRNYKNNSCGKQKLPNLTGTSPHPNPTGTAPHQQTRQAQQPQKTTTTTEFTYNPYH